MEARDHKIGVEDAAEVDHSVRGAESTGQESGYNVSLDACGKSALAADHLIALSVLPRCSCSST